MRAAIVDMGLPVPCKSRGTCVNCCKDVTRCGYFVLSNWQASFSAAPEKQENNEKETAYQLLRLLESHLAKVSCEHNY
ncbi:hypothetical protein BDV10DRAFT_171553, partial [Aspergillus recurvatus]